MNEDEQKTFDKFFAPLRTYMLERQQAWILGSGDVMAEWDDYIETINQLGYGEVIEVMQSAYDRQYGS